MDLHLVGKRALVTGGSRGIGFAIATALAHEGVDVAIAARNRTRLETAADELTVSTGRTIVPIAIDTGDAESIAVGVAAATSVLGGIDILVNNAATAAGPGQSARFGDVTADALLADVNVKILGYLRCVQAVAPQMIERRWGRIINISGLAARHAIGVIGSVRNVGVAAMTKNLADELGPHGITVTVVHPGFTRTKGTDERIAAQAEIAGMSIPDYEARATAGTALGRLVEAAEVADIVAFLASPRSAAITGDAIVVAAGPIGPIHY
jgi:NAD(P)-dependent dehydrogenase (short-subunit alcohol dehydrogenase family)